MGRRLAARLVRVADRAPVLSHLDARRDHNFPDMAVGIGEISAIAAIIGQLRGLQQRRAL